MADTVFRRNNTMAVMAVCSWRTANIGLLVALIFAATPAHADDHLSASTDFIKDLSERAITALTAEGITKESRRDKFRDLFRDGFAVNDIVRFVLGRYWRGVSEADRAEYMALFEDVIVNSWADRFSEYSGQKFTVDDAVSAPSAHQSEPVAIVCSTFFTDLTTPVRIDWRVASRGDTYKITDVSVDGISMATMQLEEFAVGKNSGQIGALQELPRQKRAC